MQTYVTIINHEYGVNVTVHSTMSRAIEAVDVFVKSWWEASDGEMPSEWSERADVYFGNRDGQESYDIFPAVLDALE